MIKFYACLSASDNKSKSKEFLLLQLSPQLRRKPNSKSHHRRMLTVIKKLLRGMLCTGLYLSSTEITDLFCSDFRQQLASVIEAHNGKVFSQSDDKLRDSEEEVYEEKGGAKQVSSFFLSSGHMKINR